MGRLLASNTLKRTLPECRSPRYTYYQRQQSHGGGFDRDLESVRAKTPAVLCGRGHISHRQAAGLTRSLQLRIFRISRGNRWKAGRDETLHWRRYRHYHCRFRVSVPVHRSPPHVSVQAGYIFSLQRPKSERCAGFAEQETGIPSASAPCWHCSRAKPSCSRI